MHPSQLPTNIGNILWSGTSTINALVYLRCHVRTIASTSSTGYPTLGTGYGEYVWQVTDVMLEAPQITLERPRYQGDDEATMRQAECTIKIDSNLGLLGAAQLDGVIRRGDLEQGMVIILAEIGNGNYVDWFTGRIAGMPEEFGGTVTITAQGFLFEALRKPVLYENFGTVFNGLDNTAQTAGYAAVGFRTTAAHIEAAGSYFCIQHGIVAFDGGGREIPNITRTGGTIDITTIDLGNGIKPGLYTIIFRDANNYTITYPDGQQFLSSIYGYATGAVGIQPAYWVAPEGETLDGTDATFEFYVSWSASGNGIAMAFNLIEKALLDSWGDPVTGMSWMDVTAWEAAARRFESFILHVDATNKDNSVWENRIDNHPLSVAVLAQKILDHLGCSLCMSNDGSISITIPYIDEGPIYPHDTTNVIIGDGIKINSSGYLTNYLTAQYAWTGDAYGAVTDAIDLRINPASQIVEKVLSFPYFKAGIGARCTEWAARTFSRRYLEKQIVIDYAVHGGIGLLAQSGDRVTLISETYPRIEEHVEIFKVGKSCSDDSAVITAQVIQDFEGARSAVCLVAIGETELW